MFPLVMLSLASLDAEIQKPLAPASTEPQAFSLSEKTLDTPRAFAASILLPFVWEHSFLHSHLAYFYQIQ